MTHKQRVISNIESLSSLTESALAKISGNILTISARKMNELLGNSAYTSYVELQNNTAIITEIEKDTWNYELATTSERQLKDLEMAEAYCALYYVALALKKIDMDTVMTQIETWGEGSIKPTDILRVVEFADKYLIEAKVIVTPYRASGEEVEGILTTGGVGFIAI
ncbi:MAG TPA: hypothetical protein PLU55_04070 [Candidatus Pacearchaeota archaeon]|nr:hypothetical protein [Candidatus Pacearchaeota archaeon]